MEGKAGDMVVGATGVDIHVRMESQKIAALVLWVNYGRGTGWDQVRCVR